MKPLSFSIWGSCVSRDMFKYAAPETVIPLYLARQSFLSTNNYVPTPDSPHGLTSAFQSRLLEGDFAGNALSTIVKTNPEILVMDLVDERLGVLEQPTGYITRSKELLSSTWWESVKSSRWIQFGTKEHFTLWLPKMHALFDEIDVLLPTTKVVIFDVPFAIKDSTQQRTSKSLGRRATSWNRRYRKYIKEISSRADVISIDSSQAVAHPDHEWGPAPFHYIRSTYDVMYSELLCKIR